MEVKDIIQFMNGGKDNEVKETMKSFLEEDSIEEVKKLGITFKKSMKKIQTTKNKNDFLTKYVKIEHVFNYMVLQNEYVLHKIKKEREKSFQNLYNDELRRKHGIFTAKEENEMRKNGQKVPKQNPQMVDKYSELIFPTINIALWETEFDMAFIKAFND